MESQEKEKFNLKRMFIIIGIVLFTTAVVGGTTWYVLDQQVEENNDSYENQIQNLQKQIHELGKNEIEKSEGVLDFSDTLDWETYSNNKYSFSFNYPKGYFTRVVETEELINIAVVNNQYKDIEGETPLISVSVFPKKGSELLTWFKAADEYKFAEDIVEIRVGDYQGYQYTSKGIVDFENFIFSNDQNTYAAIISRPKTTVWGFDLKTLADTLSFN